MVYREIRCLSHGLPVPYADFNGALIVFTEYLPNIAARAPEGLEL